MPKATGKVPINIRDNPDPLDVTGQDAGEVAAQPDDPNSEDALRNHVEHIVQNVGQGQYQRKDEDSQSCDRPCIGDLRHWALRLFRYRAKRGHDREHADRLDGCHCIVPSEHQRAHTLCVGADEQCRDDEAECGETADCSGNARPPCSAK